MIGLFDPSANTTVSHDRLWKNRKKKEVSQYSLIKDHHMNEAQLHRLRKNMVVKTTTLDHLCEILNCEIQEICQNIKSTSND